MIYDSSKTQFYPSNNTFSNNKIVRNVRGIEITDWGPNIIDNNHIIFNEVGINESGGSKETKFYNNLICENDENFAILVPERKFFDNNTCDDINNTGICEFECPRNE